jgi:NADH:ubiquinone oxidoreductase subunit F (NADH-binding)
VTLVSRTLDRAPVRSLAEYVAIGGGAGLAVARRYTPADIADEIEAAGLRGRGGSGFPTGTKFRTVAAAGSARVPTTVVVNAAEGEPGTFKDRALLRTNPYRVLEGATIAALAVGAGDITVGIKASFEREIQRLERAIAETTAAGWFDGITVDVVRGPSSYLFGEETGMLEVIEGRQPFPRVTPPFRRGIEEHDTRSAGGVELAAPDGSGEAPALVDNVETLANAALILAHGADWFREVGTPGSPGTVVCTVSGATRRHGVGEVAMGTTLRDAIRVIGWGPLPDREVGIVVSGTANALIPAALLDTPLTYEAMRGAGTGLGSAGFIVYDDRTDPIAIAQGISRFLAVESCGQCDPCKRDGKALAASLAQLASSDVTDRQMADLRRRVETVTVGARCNLASQQADVVGSLLALFDTTVERHASGRAPAVDPIVVVPLANIVGGRAVLDVDQLAKQPDWSTNPADSGAAPAARLGNTPVHVDGHATTRRWPEWTAVRGDDHPLEILDEAHDVLDRLLHDAYCAEPADRAERVGKLDHVVRLHVDVTRRILYPMARRYGGDAGETIADAAERQESSLLAALGRLGNSAGDDGWSDAVGDMAEQLRQHGDHEEALVEALRLAMDPDERVVLADGLAEARMTSVISRERSGG